MWFGDNNAHDGSLPRHENLEHGISDSLKSRLLKITHAYYQIHENSSVSYSVFAMIVIDFKS